MEYTREQLKEQRLITNPHIEARLGEPVPEGKSYAYAKLYEVFDLAYEQAANGKGKERHANNEAFEQQIICQIPRFQGSTDAPLFQAIKKCLEVNRLSNNEAKVHELLGAINYIAAAIILLQDKK